jgi:2-enoate reductase
MTGQMEKNGVEVKLEKEATASLIDNINPDVVIAATGLKQAPYDAADMNSDKGSIVAVQNVLSGKAEIAENVVVLGDDQMACETADLLSETGKKVTILSEGKRIAPEMLNLIRIVLLKRLAEKGVVIFTEIKLGAITGSGLEIIEKNGAKQELFADTLVLGNNYRVDTDFIFSMRKKIPRIYLIGGCRGLRDQQDAVADGYWAGRLA